MVQKAKQFFPEEFIRDELMLAHPFWQDALAQVSRPMAVKLMGLLDHDCPLGINPEAHGVKLSGKKEETLIETMLRSKLSRPHAICLIRCGDFWECFAADAVLVVEFAGLNQKGSGLMPMAGCPLANLQQTADGLTRAGFTVAVIEQADVPGQKTKSRFLAQVLTPESPCYTFGMLLDNRREAAFPEVPPVFGLAQQAGGFLLVEVQPDLETTLVAEGLTMETVRARMERFGSSIGKVYVHADSLGAATMAGNLPIPTKSTQPSQAHGRAQSFVEPIRGVSVAAFALHVEERVRCDLNVASSVHYTQLRREPDRAAPQPLYLGTAMQLGLLPQRGTPDLLDELLPTNAPAISKALFRELLLSPPPEDVSNSLRVVTRELLSGRASLPDYRVTNPARFIRTLHAREASSAVLIDLWQVARDFEETASSTMGQVMPSILRVTSHLVRFGCDEKTILAAARHVVILIGSSVEFGAGESAYVPSTQQVPPEFFADMEAQFRGRLQLGWDQELDSLSAKVLEAARAYETIVARDFFGIDLVGNPLAKEATPEPASSLAPTSKTPGKRGTARVATGKPKPSVTLDRNMEDEALWLKKPATHMGAGQFAHPSNRFGKFVPDRYTTPAVEAALSDYKVAIDQARQRVEKLLRTISDTLGPLSGAIMHLCWTSSLLKTITLHVRECAPKGWSHDVVVSGATGPNDHPGVADEDGDGHVVASPAGDFLSVRGVFPYWMGGAGTIRNDLDLSQTVLLTGPNGGGKTVLMKSVMVTALLGCGGCFLVPATSLRCRFVRGYHAHMSINDDAKSGLSSFYASLTDMRTVLGEANQDTLVCIDEFGRGTESSAGASLAGAVVEHLAAQGVPSLFSTHWHELWDLPVKLQDIRCLHMGVLDGRPTHRLGTGRLLTSLAFPAAERVGLPEGVLRRAKEIASHYDTAMLAKLDGHASVAPGGPEGSNHPQADTNGTPALAGTGDAGENFVAVAAATQDASQDVQKAPLLATAGHAGTTSSTTAKAVTTGPVGSKGSPVGPAANQDWSLGDAVALMCEVSGLLPGEAHLVPAGHLPPLVSLGRSCLYVLRTELGYYYVGETDDVHGRLLAHRQDQRKREAVCAFVMVAGKGRARQMESRLIEAMVAAAFPMLSMNDAQHRHFGGNGDDTPA